MYTGPNIITDGLVYTLDPINPKAYPGTGTDIYNLTFKNRNLVGRNVNGAFVESGKIVFDGTNDALRVYNTSSSSFTVGNYPDITFTTNFTIEQVFKPMLINTGSLFGLRNQLIRKGQGGSTLNFWTQVDTSTSFVFFVRNNSEILRSVFFTVPDMLNNISCVSITVENFSISCYHNGNFMGTKTITSNPITGYDGDTMGISDFGGSADGYFRGEYYNCRLYNRTLSAQEILQNYNALKPRFNL